MDDGITKAYEGIPMKAYEGWLNAHSITVFYAQDCGKSISTIEFE